MLLGSVLFFKKILISALLEHFLNINYPEVSKLILNYFKTKKKSLVHIGKCIIQVNILCSFPCFNDDGDFIMTQFFGLVNHKHQSSPRIIRSI